jgi:glycosyl transferase family 87
VLHLDLLVLVAAGLGTLTVNVTSDQPAGSLVLTLVCLGYLFARLLHAGFRPGGGAGRLVPLLPATWLLVALVLLVGFRVGYALTDQQLVGDVGVASLLGADRIADGRDVYDASLDSQGSFPHPDSYGPALYLLYVPFEQLFPIGDELIGEPGYEDPAGGRVAAITFDLLTLLGLFALGRQWKPGAEGRLLGLGLAWAWASYPYSVYQLRYGFNDTLVALLVVAALLALRSPAGRGALTALAASTKFAPVVLAPLMATGTGERRNRSALLFAGAFSAVSLAVLVPLLPDGGVSEFWDRTLGYQQGRPAWYTFWARFPGLDWLRPVVQAGVVGLAVMLAFVPRRRSPEQVALLGAAVMVAVQLSITHWFCTYLLWFAPLAFAGLFAVYDCRHAARAGEEAPPLRPSRRVDPIRA